MRRRRFSRSLSAVTLALVMGLATAAHAAVPPTLTHQGRLYSDAGDPVNATLDVTFSVYDDPSAAAPVWTEEHTITFEDGYFSVSLGADAPFGDVFDGDPLYLGIKVGDNAEMTPRALVASVPYAFRAGDVTGDIHPTSVSIAGFGEVIDKDGNWVGPATGLQGPAGAEGAVGPTGPGGPAGANGAAGPTGPAGAQGPAGPVGPQGIQGIQGPAGAQGIQGTIGPIGPQGVQGPVGAAGPMGPAGALGPTGPAGATGATGATGAVGPMGPAGATGAQGPAGPAGIQGPAGAQGPAGPTGAVGPTGPVGPAGANGAVGPTGPIGAAGADGAVGPTGPQGAGRRGGSDGPGGIAARDGVPLRRLDGHRAELDVGHVGGGPPRGAVYRPFRERHHPEQLHPHLLADRHL